MNPIDSSDSTMPAKQPHAVYSERLLPALAQRLAAAGLKRVDARELRPFTLLYSVCPQIRETLSPTLIHYLSFCHLAELSSKEVVDVPGLSTSPTPF